MNNMVEIVRNGLQSCLESELVDSRRHSLTSHSPKLLTPHQPIHIPIKACLWEPNAKLHCEEKVYNINHSNPNNNQNDWRVCKDKETANRQVKYSSVVLSRKSLEVCTENLGNETGSDNIMMDNEIKMLCPSLWECGERREKKKGREVKKFPPPLASIRSGSDSLKMIPRREGGRLVIELHPSASCFHAERIHGRLRLSFLREQTEEDESEQEVQRDLEGEEQTELECNENERETCGNSWNIGPGIRIMENYDIRGRRMCNCKEGDYENNGFGIAAVNVLTA